MESAIQRAVVASATTDGAAPIARAGFAPVTAPSVATVSAAHASVLMDGVAPIALLAGRIVCCARVSPIQGMYQVGIGSGLNIDFFNSLRTILIRKRDVAHIVFVQGVGARSYRAGVFMIDVKNARWEIGRA